MFSAAALLALANAASAQRLLLDVYGANGSEFGFAIAPTVDLDQDGAPDLVVGAPGTASGLLAFCGAGHLLSSRTGVILASTGLGLPGTRLGDRALGLHDLDGDGSADFVLAGPRGSVTGQLQGYAAAFRRNGSLLWSAFGEDSSEFGTGLCGVRDITGNGRDDLLVGAPQNSNVRPFGRIQPFDGTTGTSLGMIAGSDRTMFGFALVNLGDIDGDGADDVAASEPNFTFSNNQGGRIMLLRSNRLGSSAVVWQQFTPFAAGDHAGRALGAAGDVDGDGRCDLLVSTSNGRVYLLSGATGAVITSLLDTYGSFGSSLCGLGDQNGDGRAEFAIGAPTYNGGQGRVYVYDGATRNLLWFVEGNVNSGFGHAIANAGDQDGDGRGDLAVGAPVHARFGGVPGRVAIYGTAFPSGTATFGSACGGSLGLLDAIATGAPLPGQTIGMRVYNLPPQSFGFWCLGLSRTQSAFGALPFDLGGLGVPGCWLLQSCDATVGFATGNNQYRSLLLSLPNWPALAGIRLYGQAAMLDASHAGGLTSSNGVEFRIGNL